MKRCPTCQKEFADSMRFCQTDGTPLVEVEEKAPPPDPYKTVVGGLIKMDDDFLQIPEQNDPMKTMVGPGEPPKTAPPKSDPPLPKPPSEPTINVPPKVESKPFEQAPPPKSSEPSLNPPSFGDLSSGSASKAPPISTPNQPPKNEPVPPKAEPPSPFGASPFSSEAGKSASPFDKKPDAPASSPFDRPVGNPVPPPIDKTPPPPYKDPEPMFGGQQPPAFNQSPFSQPQTPFGQSNEPFNQPFQQDEWAPPPAPVAGWQDQGLGTNTPFQPPAAGGQNNTLAIVSLVCGILSVCLCGFLTGIPALITGFMAKNNIDANPAEYGGRGMALAGMILGGISVVLSLIYVVFVVLSAMAR